MQSIKVKSHVGSDGILHIPLPEIRDADVEVVIVYQTLQSPKGYQTFGETSTALSQTRSVESWSPEFLSTFGSWQGEPLFRAPQEEPSEREQFL